MSDTLIARICTAAGPPKRLARLTGASPASARRWQAGTAAMPADKLLRLAAACAAARERLLAGLGLDEAACLARLDAIDTALAALRQRQEARRDAMAAADGAGRAAAQPDRRAGRGG
ncbi:MAG: hypothetical protein N2688_00045 [Burkholderiaceae bacterium]|nr:hypothetical protein [Burkholderiaceae bacterium]